MAPRPILLTYNGEDDCCFRASLVKPRVFDAIQPFFGLYGHADNLYWHENREPGDHNYQLDNRLADYSFFTKQFGLPPISDEAGIPSELRSYEELVTPLPEDNLTILGLAREMARELKRSSVPATATERAAWATSERDKLKDIVRYQPVEMQEAWGTAMTKSRGVQSISYLFQLNNGLSASGIWLRSISQSSDTAPVTIVLHDEGRSAAADIVKERFSRGEQVLALDLMFTGSPWKGKDTFELAQMLGGLGERPLGLQVEQLIRIARWAEHKSGTAKVRLEVSGIRNQAAALVAAALEPDLFSEITVRDGIRSFSYLLEKPVTYAQAPELFCLDLYKEFDIDRLEALAAPVTVQSRELRELPGKKP